MSITELTQDLVDSNNRSKTAGFYNTYRVKKAEAEANGMRAAGKQLAELSKGLQVAQQILNQVSEDYSSRSRRLHLTGVIQDRSRVTLLFGREPEILELQWEEHRNVWTVGDQYGVSSLDVINRMSVTQDYLDGITDILREILPQRRLVDLLNEISLEDRVPKWHHDNEWWKLVRKHRNTICDLMSLSAEDIASRSDSIRSRQQAVSLSASTRHLAARYEMPDVPVARTTVKHATQLDPFPGVYFGWKDGVCFYVGRSLDVPKRLKSHDKLTLDDDVSWVECERSQIFTWELFYIWLLSPSENNEVRLAERQAEKSIREPAQ